MKRRLLRIACAILAVAIVVITVWVTLFPTMRVQASGNYLSISLNRNETIRPPQQQLDPHYYDPVTTDTSVGGQLPVDTSWTAAVLPWSWQMANNNYQVKVKNNITAGQVVEFSRQGKSIKLQPMALEWTNNLDQIQSISMPQDVTPVVDQTGEGSVNWLNAYGNGIDFKWQTTPISLDKTLEIENLSKLPAPAPYIIAGGNPVLRLNLIFAPSSDVLIFVDGSLWDKKTTIQTFNKIEFRLGNEILWSFSPLMYWDADNTEGQSVATLSKSGQNLYISIRVPYSWLQTAVYPVFVDADITIEASAHSTSYGKAGRAGIFWKSTTVGYVVFVDSSVDLKYRKTGDGGATWAAAVNIVTGTISFFDCWADWQTVGDAGTKIHIGYIDSDTDDIRYVYLETSTDTVGGDAKIADCGGGGAIVETSGSSAAMISITKTRGGNLGAAFHYQDTSYTDLFGFYTSPDASTWTSKTSPWEASQDMFLLFAGNEADNQDIWGIFWDTDANAISLKTFDNSANTWSEQAIASSMTFSNLYMQMDGQIRLSDGHLILAAWSQYDNAASDLMVWDINGAGSITAKTNIITNEAESFTVSVFVNPVNDDIYVAYCSGTAAASEVAVFYQKSTNGGTNWGGETAMQAGAEDDERWVSAGCMKASLGGKFQPVWFNDDFNDLFTNTDNGVSIAAAASYDITETTTSKAFGFVVASATLYAHDHSPVDPTNVAEGDCTFTLTNNAASICDLDMKMADFTGGVGWNIEETANPSTDEVMITAYYVGQNVVNGLLLKNADQEFYDALAGSAHIHWDFSMLTGTSFTDGVAKSGVLTITAVAED
jgi:hypothetical protein